MSNEEATQAKPVGELDLSPHFSLDWAVTFLNHGSFGAVPRRIQNVQNDFRRQMEAEPVRFFTRELPGLVARVRSEFCEFVGATPENLAFVSNATEGVNAVLRSMELKPGDEILVTDQGYGACTNAAEFVARRSGAKVVTAKIPLPLSSPQEVTEAILEEVTDSTRLALIDHITSPTALVFPIKEIVAALKERGVETLVDGAHAPGMVALNLDEIGAAYYAGNCHKWLCTPRGVAFLHVRDDLLETVRPTSISHGAAMGTGKARFHLEFDWTGTKDPTGLLCLPETLRFLASLLPGRMEGIFKRYREHAVYARTLLLDAFPGPPLCPESMLGSMAAVELPIGEEPLPQSIFDVDPLQERLFEEHGIEVPIFVLRNPDRRLLRVSCALYNGRSDYERLAEALDVQSLTDLEMSSS